MKNDKNLGSFGSNSIRFSLTKRLIVFLSMVTFVSIQARNAPDAKVFSNSEIENILPQQEVSGTITDTNGVPIPGASVVEKGTTNGTAADFDGNFSINVSSEATLVFSSLGYSTKEIAIGQSVTINVQLEEDSQALDEVVVTALGIKKESKKLGYAVATVKPAELNTNRSTNFMNTLQGKVPGVNVAQPSTGPGGSSKVRIRGQSSLGANNNPLIVVNGVPIDNTNFGANPQGGGRRSGVFSDSGDGFSSINPDDIESMTVLKGAASAALYGSRAKDGVILINTKTKGTGQGIGVTYNSNVTINTPLDFTDYQYEYGQGENGVRPTSANPTSGQWSFGEKFAPGLTQTLFDGIELPYAPVRNRIRKFYRDGSDVTHSIGLSGSNEKGGFHLSLSDLNSKGIVPNNSFDRTTVNFGASYDFNDKLSLSTNISYSNERNTNPPNIGEQDNTVTTSISNLANSMPLDVLEANAFNADGNEFVYSRFRNRTNPYFTLSEQFNNIVRDRIFGNVTLKYNFFPWLSLQGRVGQDFYTRAQDFNGYPTGQASRRPAPEGFVNGEFTQSTLRQRETNVDFLVNINKQFGDFGIDLNIGGNQMRRTADQTSVLVEDFVVRGLYTVENGRVKTPTYDLAEIGVNSLYAAADFSFKDTYFLSVTARNDWFSTLSPEERSILYPSISGSYLFSNHVNSDWLTFGKLRASYAEAGSDNAVAPGTGILGYQINSNLFANQPLAGANTSQLPNSGLVPLRIKEYEFGIDLRMFDNRVGIDLAYYNKDTFNEILSSQISNTSGFSTKLVNSGQLSNKGIEALLRVTPVKNENFQWDANFNLAYNKTKVVKLLTDEPGELIQVGRHVFNGFLYQVVGEEIGQLAGFGYKYDAQGRQIFSDDGRAARSDDIRLFGSALPKYVGGITNNLRYKDFNMSFLIDFKLGGKMISGTNFNATRHGLHKMTLPGRDTGVVGDGVNEAGETNTVATPSQRYWEVIRSKQIVEPIVYNSGFWKLRQITLGYDFQKLIPETSPFKAVKLSLVANNVLMLKKWVPNIDPDSFGNSSDNLVGLEGTGVPTTRSLGFNLNVKF